MCYDFIINLNCGAYICRRGLFFDFLDEHNSIIVNCNRFDYIPGKLVAMERYDEIHIYSIETLPIKEVIVLKNYLCNSYLYFKYRFKNYKVSNECKFILN